MFTHSLVFQNYLWRTLYTNAERREVAGGRGVESGVEPGVNVATLTKVRDLP